MNKQNDDNKIENPIICKTGDINPENSSTTEKEQFYTDKQVANIYQIGRSTVWSFVKEGYLPEPIKIGSRTTRFRGSELPK